MSAADISNDLLESFAPLVRDEAHLTFVLGAGASAPSGLPMWDEFARRVALSSGLVDSETAAGLLLSRQDPALVLEGAHAAAGDRWEDLLVEALYRGEFDPVPSPLHYAVAGHKIERPDSTTVATLNFDVLLEQALASREADGTDTVIEMSGHPIDGELSVHHLHGVVAPGIVRSPVVSHSDYMHLQIAETPWQLDFLDACVRSGPLLFAGTSYRDPDIRQWLHRIRADKSRTAYTAIVTIVREGLGLSRKDFSSIEDALVKEWESVGLLALRLHDLCDIATVIRELAFVGQPEYVSPQERVRRIWDAHAEQLKDLQPRYSAELEQSARTISSAAGCKATAPTMWLADARGRIARWAGGGVIHQRIRTMRRVPTGHDSPRIAGEIVGTEEMKLKDEPRNPNVQPARRSVLGVPLYASDGVHPPFVCGALTFGMSVRSETLLKRREWYDALLDVGDEWGERLSRAAY
ncbi:SIR2 family protein [Schaalia hyovaginalis]|uniref:SIR2 family protein n=1 Tax=Schaalia hyovaginalis TaxID=29316 RepID=UPI0026EB8E39|nr:SIR2 family protein [Schaalia hyovaginalis]MCI6557012.1 SIR2 family protein [Schaalia hyovaginalis]MDD7554817.1 SIR2 family protein [Schaalia hyovaginalis]MDY3093227.1 SIR2 family protein [Schaalia hyovaginalis]